MSNRIMQIQKDKLYFMDKPTIKNIKRLINKYLVHNKYSNNFVFNYDINNEIDILEKFKDFCDICTYYTIKKGNLPYSLRNGAFFTDIIEKEKEDYIKNSSVEDLFDKLRDYRVSNYDILDVIKEEKTFLELLEDSVFTENEFYNCNNYANKFKSLNNTAVIYYKNWLDRERSRLGVKSDSFIKIAKRKQQIVENKLLDFAKELKLRYDINLDISNSNNSKIVIEF